MYIEKTTHTEIVIDYNWRFCPKQRHMPPAVVITYQATFWEKTFPNFIVAQ